MNPVLSNALAITDDRETRRNTRLMVVNNKFQWPEIGRRS